MNTNLNNINNFLISLSLINSFYYKNSYLLYKKKKIILNFNIQDFDIDNTSVYFPKTLWLLEHIGLQKGIVINLKTKRVGRNQRRVNFSSQIVLRNNKFLNFLYFFLCFLIYGFFRKFLIYNNKIDKITGDYLFLIKDINIFPGLLEDFFKWSYSILVKIIVSDYNIITNQHVFQELGLTLY
jgi:hypothetical protein